MLLFLKTLNKIMPLIIVANIPIACASFLSSEKLLSKFPLKIFPPPTTIETKYFFVNSLICWAIAITLSYSKVLSIPFNEAPEILIKILFLIIILIIYLTDSFVQQLRQQSYFLFFEFLHLKQN